ncbi:MAG: putative ABC exporter domain-containing protein [Propionibacteriaceae bacterium]|nr:putative ABC exporter domain-containing protein [Propionibacteriaceae bacterium]
MRALTWLLLTSLKNSLMEIWLHKSKLITYAVVLASVTWGTVSGLRASSFDTAWPLVGLTVALFAFGLLSLFPSVRQGLKGGATIFTMSDVNLAFVSPISPRANLAFGLGKALLTGLVSVLMALVMAPLLGNAFNAPPGASGIIVAALILPLIIGVAGSMAIYLGTNSRPRRKRLVVLVCLAVFVPVLVWGIGSVLGGAGADPWAIVAAIAGSPAFSLIPVLGWTAAGATAFVSGQTLIGLGFLGLDLLLLAATIAYVLLASTDYYEDVLSNAQTVYDRRQALAEGNMDAAMAAGARPGVVRDGRRGLGGRGAAAIFLKHLREDYRQSRLGLMTPFSIVQIVVAIGLTVFMVFSGGPGGPNGLQVPLIVMMALQTVFIGTGRGSKELTTHYLYLIPESSLKKMIWANLEAIVRALIEGAVALAAAGLIVAAGALDVIVAWVVYTLFSAVLLGVTFVYLRLFSDGLNQLVQMALFYVTLTAVMAPGVVAGVVIGLWVGPGAGSGAAWLTTWGIIAAWEALAAVGCFALASGVLDDCDMVTVKVAV